MSLPERATGALSPVDVNALVEGLTARGLTIATAESLTGGALCARLVDVPGASAVVRGGVCAYAVGAKADILGVDPERLAVTGPVDREIAIEMARGAVRLFGADIGVSTTGVAGPGPDGPHPAGTVYIACAHPAGILHDRLLLSGGRAQVRAATVDAALRLVARALASAAPTR
ncbi:CinA family protein [Actinomyces sp. B33]|uniref:CinA family protein n=1 Tax=Actinomyces sp. B33 TaxID=2942131 RepID=UPI00234124F9|nr:CinA family protein [Actinomyces sp. B33]MDC4233055.1 CinA family protein [Actinomyces sp. B33]